MRTKVIVKQPELADNIDLYAALGVKSGVSRDEVDRVYAEFFAKAKSFDPAKHLAWKILRDSYYRPLYDQSRSLKYVYDAGFFVDRLLPEQVGILQMDKGLLTTPFHKITANLGNLKADQKPVVLLTTGGFSPIHHGHLSLMETAKVKLEEKGMTVVGGYFSPSHDDYVSTKYGGEAELNSAHRIYLARVAVNDSDWLMVDPWEASYVPTDVNFTDVIERLQTYLRYHLEREDLEVFYVFGADNGKFARVFKDRNGCVCVTRDGYEMAEVQNEPGIADNQKIIFTRSIIGHANYSSTTARKWKANLMPDEVSNLYFRWRKNVLSSDGVSLQPRKLYIIRDEDSWAIDPWIKKFGEGKLLAAKETFKNNLAQAIRGAFLHVGLPDLPVDVDIRFYHLDDQIQYVEQLERQEQVLNLDICTNNGSGVNFSRQFYLSDGQFRSRELIGRPGFASINEQIDKIKAGTYTLLDDDIASGSTINMLMGLLPETVRINKIRTLMDYSRKKYNHVHLGAFDVEAFDVVDLRDFIIGSKTSGLVVSLPNGEVARAPYLQPYISLISRASIPPSTEMMLSKRILELNLEFFESLGEEMTIADFDLYTQKLFSYLGYTPDTAAVDLCREHLKVFG
ncbi:hypothetical protein IT411_01705 [Candidatus Peregrinibacteria bacterium]|nr:hypothetical protein [Candidatus Peregrinibacteria bacterium]